MANILRKIFCALIFLKIYGWYSLRSFFGVLKESLLNVLSKNRVRADAHKDWAIRIFNYLKVKLYELPGSQELRPGRTMIFANHRSQADFFLHNAIMNYQVNFLSRMAVLIMMPVFYFERGTVWFFNRGANINPDKFNAWLDQKFDASPRPALLAYPEGHRMQGVFAVDRSKIKTGMIRYAYRRGLPSQILMSFGNEEVLDEKRLHISWGKTVGYKLSGVIDPTQFEQQNDFVQKIKDEFCKFFEEVHQQFSKMETNR